MKASNKPTSKMDELLLKGESRSVPKIGELVEGTIITVAKNEVTLDIDGLTTGVVRGKEIYDESGEYSEVKSGDRVSATVLEIENES
ncbi:MAG TPA: S1 RNA-binding domain-containing protein, partial [Patescibacteria group bacterium]|nr:S1 RNA-binding domain-containing protein [Patescibacteria group bacterium]